MARLIIADSGGTERVLRRFGMVDSGGTARMLKRLFLCDSGGTARLIYESLRVATQPANVSGSSAAGNPSGTVTSSAATCAGAGSNGVLTYAWHPTNCAANSPSNASTDFYATVNAGSTDNASAYCTISDGVNSVNTNTISVSLTNTTPAAADFTITAGQDVASQYIGYNRGGFGTLNSSSGFLNGTYLGSLFDDNNNTVANFEISGFSSDPGASSLSSVTINGQTRLASNATYSYSSGSALWQWNQYSGGPFGLVNGTQYAGSATPTGSAW